MKTEAAQAGPRSLSLLTGNEICHTSRYVLGKLCPRGHAWGETGQALLRIIGRHCLACDREVAQAHRRRLRQAGQAYSGQSTRP